MTIPDNFDMAAFQADVIQEVTALEDELPAGKSPAGWRAVLEGASSDEGRAAQARQAEADLKKEMVRQVICAALQDFSGDAVKLALTLTPVLVGAAFAGTITIPLTPFYVGVMVLLVARMGVSGLCAGMETGGKE